MKVPGRLVKVGVALLAMLLAVVLSNTLAAAWWICIVFAVGIAQGALAVSLWTLLFERRQPGAKHAAYALVLLAAGLLYFSPWWRFYVISLGIAVSMLFVVVATDIAGRKKASADLP
jgi:hypothetical protein